MSKSNTSDSSVQRAVALQYGGTDTAPVIVASGMGYQAEKIVEVAADSGVPIYEDNSLATILSQFQLGQEIPASLYQAIVDIYLYFLEFDPYDLEKQSGRQASDVTSVEATSVNEVGEDA